MAGPHGAVPFLYEPGTSFKYSFSSDLLGFIVEVTGQTLEAYSQQNIFQSLGVNVTYRLNEGLASKLVDLSFFNLADGPITPWNPEWPLIQRYPKPGHECFMIMKMTSRGVAVTYSSIQSSWTLEESGHILLWSTICRLFGICCNSKWSNTPKRNFEARHRQDPLPGQTHATRGV
ncbi:hypothetical protein CC2G_004284 [Coprinopsis cinerea AmutBmut pab1-1]|nr:hypothetical protein CC2G_004284 [Coprinopsis cinerea AmutBmut pab1-1]